jgi:hypothetical protein
LTPLPSAEPCWYLPLRTTPAIASPMLRPTSQMMLRPLDLAAGLRQRGAERVAEREVAQVADVQRLGRVGVPEVEREAPPRRCRRSRRRPLASSSSRRAATQPSSRRSQLPLAALDRRHPGQRSDLVQGGARVAVLPPAVDRGTSIRSKRSLGRYGARSVQCDWAPFPPPASSK